MKPKEELEEYAEQVSNEVGRCAAEAASRIEGWGSMPLDKLVEQVDMASTANLKGRILEKMIARLFETVPGLTTVGRIRTVTEEIDISILNSSADPRFLRESAILLAECKNWSGKCGKDEFVVFQNKLANRSERCSLGFLVSWNGFTETVTSEMLRGSRERLLIIPLEGKQLRGAVRDGDFTRLVFDAWQKAVML